MPKYLIEASYTREGVEGVRSAGGSSRVEAVRRRRAASAESSRASTLGSATTTRS